MQIGSVRIKGSTRILYGLALALAFGVALFIRVYFPHDNVFAGDWVRFQINDPWYHMRQVENLVHHFPHQSLFDPYRLYPGGQNVDTAPFFDLLLGFFIWVIDAGSPSKNVIETVGAYFPAILGALVTIPVYFIGKELFSRTAGLLAAFLIAILPGEFLMRSLLGFTDHHAGETLFSTVTILFLILAIKSSKGKDISFTTVRNKDWKTLRTPLIYSLLTGVSLGVYLLSWTGGALFIFIIFAFAIIQYLSDHLRGRSTDYLCLTAAPAFIVALLIILPFSGQYQFGNLQVISLIIGILTFLALSSLSFLMVRRNMNRAYYPLSLVILGGIGLTLFWLIEPSLLNSILSKFSIFSPTAAGPLTIAEVRGLPISSAWSHFTTAFYLSLISLAIIVYLVIKEGDTNKTLLLVWSVIMLVATFDLWLTAGQKRFAYYFAVNASILTAYLTWKVLELAGFKEKITGSSSEQIEKSTQQQTQAAKTTPAKKKAKQKNVPPPKKEPRTPSTGPSIARIALGLVTILVVFFGVFYPNIGEAIEWAEGVRGPNNDWHEALVWLKENTPDPFTEPDSYYALYKKPQAGETYDYPDSAYGIMSWWDYGYHITYIAQRIPNANPTQSNADRAGAFLTAPLSTSTDAKLDKLGSKYIVIDYPMATPLLKYHAMIKWSGKNESDFYEVYYKQEGMQLIPTMYYHPAFYQSMCSRLYIFGGKEWVPQQSLVVSLTTREVLDTEGNTLSASIITDEKTFPTYDDAKAFIDANPDYLIVGTDPFLSPVPLEELEHYQLIYKSPSTVATRGAETISYVEIFEYVP